IIGAIIVLLIWIRVGRGRARA
ncbi:MAG: hypothetical protein JWP61_1551, partial [Friedmanniella sp.]|nr:hypothetical protein [Friedmanniella sp.]